MTRLDGVRLALASLIENPLRSFLTLVGIAMGVTAVIFVVSVINGLNLYVAEKLSVLGPDVFVVDKYGIIKSHEEWVRARRRNPDLKWEDVAAIRRQTTLVDKIAVTKDTGTTVKRGKNSVTDVYVRAATAEVFEIEPYEIADGRAFSSAEVDRAARVCVLGWDVADTLFPRGDGVGREVTALGRGFQVIGVGEKRGSSFGQSEDNYAMIPITAYEKIRGSWGSLSIAVRASDPNRVEDAIDEVRSALRARHHVKYNDDDDFGIVTADALMTLWRDLTVMIFNVAVFVVSISLVVGGIVIMNIMLLTVVERTREIGVRKAVGARYGDIFFQFLAESVMLCALGGVLGVGMGWAGVGLVRVLTPLPAKLPLWAPILAVSVTSAVGVFFGLHPARHAGRLDPIEALRSETV